MVGVAESLLEETEENLARGVVLPELELTGGDCFTSSGGAHTFLRTGVPGVSEEPELSMLSDRVVGFGLAFPETRAEKRNRQTFRRCQRRRRRQTIIPFDANLSEAVDDRLESVAAVDADGGTVVLAGVAFLCCSTASTESSSDSLSDDSSVSVCATSN